MKRILVIEDEPEMLRNMLTILKMEGYATLSAEIRIVGVRRCNEFHGVDRISQFGSELG